MQQAKVEERNAILAFQQQLNLKKQIEEKKRSEEEQQMLKQAWVEKDQQIIKKEADLKLKKET